MLAAINRVCEPRSKRGIGAWYNRTMLPSLFTIPVGRATGQRFWDAMDRLPVEAIPCIEQELWGTSLDQFSIPLDWLLYDTSNFFSYLAEQTPSQLNEKGHNKAFRHHLRQVGLAVSVIRGLGLPLIHELSSLSLGLWVTRSGKLFKIISDRSKLQAKLFSILCLHRTASTLGVHQDSS